MKITLYTVTFITIFTIFGCSSPHKVLFDDMPQTNLIKSDFASLPQWENENYKDALNSFVKSCQSSKTKKIYKDLCIKANKVQNAKDFFETYFQPYKISKKDGEEQGLLTGYYEAELYGSLKKTSKYKYPIYATPSDLITVDLASLYPELKHLRLRGRLENNKLIPYYKRGELNGENKNAKVLCYVDSKIDLFFLEIQGSGRVTLDDGSSIFVGYANQNGHKYRAIGKYLVEIGAMSIKEVSLQSIRHYLITHPNMLDEVLNYNESKVYFALRNKSATGALGLELSAYRSIAVDRKYIPLGSLVFVHAEDDNKVLNVLANAQDTGGAIKGAVRADLFLGYGEKAMQIAGKLKANLELWILLPKDKKVKND